MIYESCGICIKVKSWQISLQSQLLIKQTICSSIHHMNDHQQSPEGLAFIMPLIGCMTSQVRSQVSKICKHAGYSLTPEEADTLMIIHHCDGLPQTQLANVLGKDKAAITRLMNALVKSGLVGRIQDQQDRRVLRAQITAEGKQAFIQVWPELMKLSDQALKGIPAQNIHIMQQTVTTINENLAVYRQDCACKET